MKKFINILIFFTIIFIIFLYSSEITEGIRFSFTLCINHVFPSLIPFMLLSNILINFGSIDDLADIFNLIMKLFKVNKNVSFAFVMSILSGSPSNAVYLKNLYDNNLIRISDLNKSLYFCHFANPIFVISTVGYTFLNSKKIGLIILFSTYISSFLIGIIGKRDTTLITNNKRENNKVNFILVLKQSIKATIDTLLLILGIITMCIIITSALNNILNIDNNFKFMYGLLEITQGLKYLSLNNLNINIKAVLASFLISFGGLCIHAQVFSIIDNKKVRYLPYFIFRIIHGLLSALITFILIVMFL